MSKELIVLALTLGIALIAGSFVDFLIHRGNQKLVRILERDRNAHNAQVESLLNRIDAAYNKRPYYTPKPEPVEEPEETEEEKKAREEGWRPY